MGPVIMKKATDAVRGKTRGVRGSAVKPRVDRILVGVRIEPRLVKVMKALSELHDCALGELIERVFWHSMDGGNAFGEKGKMTAETRKQISNLKEVYGVDYDIGDLAKLKNEE